MPVDLLQNCLRKLVPFQQMPKVKQGRGIRHIFHTQINSSKSSQSLTVVKCIFEGFVSQGVPLLKKIDSQHSLYPDGRTSAASVGIVWLNQFNELRPRDD